tara:strand:+ start:2999 stop:3580 length:582 start_codon:yes stop_codon:yes gene_type:complete
MYQVGFIFLYSNNIPLKPFTKKNKLKYNKKILVHSFTTILEIENNQIGFKLYNTDKKISMKNIEQFLHYEFDFSQDEIIDYNPIRKSLIKNIDKSISLFSVILNHTKPTINLNLNLNLRRFVLNKMLPFYSLDTVNPNTYDVCEAINKYHKLKKIELSDIICINNNNLVLHLSILFKSMYGLIIMDDETKRYI